MFYNYYQTHEYQYDSCIAKGVCSTDPMTIALQEVFLIYLKQIAFYMSKLEKLGITNDRIRKDIIVALSSLVSIPDINEEQFFALNSRLSDDFMQSKLLYEKMCKKNHVVPKKLKETFKVSKNCTYSQAIKQGEKEFLKRQKKLSKTQSNLYEIMFLLIKSVCINLIELTSFDSDYSEAYLAILELLDTMNYHTISEEELKEQIQKFVKVDYELIKELNKEKIKEFGEIEKTEVSYSTRPNKAILIEGSDLKELQEILEITKDKNIDIYTHGSMINAFMYPKFKQYKNLIGQFGMGVENCLLDFATFPGAIFLTKHSLHNIEYLYRGRLFTTDEIVPKGVVKIENKNYDGLIKSTLEAKGFSKGRQREFAQIGYDEAEIMQKVEAIIQKISSGKIKHLFIVGDISFSPTQKDFFDKFFKNLSQDDFVITLSKKEDTENIMSINSFYDYSIIYKILERISQKKELKEIPTTVYLTTCDKHTISRMFILKMLGIEDIILCKCSPIMLNPSLGESLTKMFKIKSA